MELNRLLDATLPEEAVFWVDHFLAISTVQNILGSRLANRLLEPVWNSNHIEEIEIVWDETVALEGGQPTTTASALSRTWCRTICSSSYARIGLST